MEILAYIYMALAYQEVEEDRDNCAKIEPNNCQNLERENADCQAAFCEESTKNTPCHLQAAEG